MNPSFIVALLWPHLPLCWALINKSISSAHWGLYMLGLGSHIGMQEWCVGFLSSTRTQVPHILEKRLTEKHNFIINLMCLSWPALGRNMLAQLHSPFLGCQGLAGQKRQWGAPGEWLSLSFTVLKEALPLVSGSLPFSFSHHYSRADLRNSVNPLPPST